MTFPAAQWAAVKAIFSAAAALEGPARAAFLDDACGDDAAMRQHVDSLLASHEEAQSFLETPAAAVLHMPPSADDVTGRTIGTYRVESRLGSGGMGDVYRAYDTNLDRPVALKLLPAAVAADAGRLRRFRAEARAASSLNHPHILVIHDFGDVDGRAFIVTELVEGETLRQRLHRGPLAVREAVDIAVQVAGALAAAHARGIVHRDIKPENVMLRPDGYVKVLDFGLAKLLAQATPDLERTIVRTNPGLVMGTPGYMSPEQARGLDVDARSDVWSVGVLVYELVAGRPPFGGATSADVMAAILSREPEPLDRVVPTPPRALVEIVAKSLAKDAGDRFASAEELHQALTAARATLDSGVDTPVPAGMPTALVTSPPRSAPRWRPAVLAAVAVAAMAVAGFFVQRNLTAKPDAPAAPSAQPDIASGKNRLAVLPFENLTRNATDDWLSGGLSDSLTFGLQNLNALILTTRDRITDVYQQHQVHESAPLDPKVVRTLVQALGVQYYVHGTYQRVGNDIRVVARLVLIETGEVTAQESVTDLFANILKVEDDLANRFAAKLDVTGGAVRPVAGTTSVDAYRAYSEAQAMYVHRLDPNTTLQRLHEATVLDPRYAQAWALMSKVYSRMVTGSAVEALPADNENVREAWRTAQQAVDIDPLLYDAHVALALAHRRGQRIGPWRTEAEKAIELNPRVAEAYGVLASSYSASPSWSCARDRDAALAEQYYRTGIRLEPRAPLAYGGLVDHLLWNRDAGKALGLANEGLQAVPGNDYLKSRRVYALLNLGRTDEARATLREMEGGRMTAASDQLLVELWLETWGGRQGPAALKFRDTYAGSSAAIFQIQQAFQLATVNLPALAFPHVEQALRLDARCREYIMTSAALSPLRNTTEFAAVLARTR